jgi:hypothetical protein
MDNVGFFLLGGFFYVGRIVIYVGIFSWGLFNMGRITWGLLENHSWAFLPDLPARTTQMMLNKKKGMISG